MHTIKSQHMASKPMIAPKLYEESKDPKTWSCVHFCSGKVSLKLPKISFTPTVTQNPYKVLTRKLLESNTLTCTIICFVAHNKFMLV